MTLNINHGDSVDQGSYEFRQDFLQKFKASYAKPLNPMSEIDEELMDWNISNLVWSADTFAYVFGKEQLRDVLRHLMRDESYWY